MRFNNNCKVNHIKLYIFVLTFKYNLKTTYKYNLQSTLENTNTGWPTVKRYPNSIDNFAR